MQRSRNENKTFNAEEMRERRNSRRGRPKTVTKSKSKGKINHEEYREAAKAERIKSTLSGNDFDR